MHNHIKNIGGCEVETRYPTVIATVGGAGTRLYPLTLNIAKPIVDLCNKAVLAWMLESLALQGCRRFIFAGKGYDNTAQLNKYFKSGKEFFSTLNLHQTHEFMYEPNYEDTGSADSMRYCMDYYNVEGNILVVSGDNVVDFDLENLIKQHEKSGAILTVGLKELEPEEKVFHYGVAELGGGMRLKGFVEKPEQGREPSRLINTSIYLFSPEIKEVFDEMGEEARDIGRDLIPYLTSHDYQVNGYMVRGYWADVGTPGRFWKTSMDILGNKLKHINLEHPHGKNAWVHPDTVSRNSSLRDVGIGGGSLIARGCRIERGARIERSSIGHTCMIGGGSEIKNSIVSSFCRIGENVKLNKCILGRYTTLGDGSIIDADLDVEYLGEPSERIPVIGGGGVRLPPHSVIGPGKRAAPIRQSHRILSTGKYKELGMDRENVYFVEA